jgi:hypothetical protein
MAQVLRLNGVQKQTGLGKTNLIENYIYHGREGEEFVADTDIKRLRPIRLGPRALGFLASEVDDLIAALARRRDSHPETMRARMPPRRAAPTSPPARPRRRKTEAPVRRPQSTARRGR